MAIVTKTHSFPLPAGNSEKRMAGILDSKRRVTNENWIVSNTQVSLSLSLALGVESQSGSKVWQPAHVSRG